MKEIRISVRGLVEFLLRSGNIDNRIHHAPDTAMQEGSRIHRMIQKSMGADYRAEVPLSYTVTEEDYILTIDGRADGIWERKDQPVLIDEIKGTYRDLKKIKEPDEVHVAQARCYAAIYAEQNELENISVQITYCNIDTEEIRRFTYDHSISEIRAWFEDLLGQYHRWAQFLSKWDEIRTESIHNMGFPFEYRAGQKELAANVYRTIYHSRKLFLEAPTGTGKTLSTVFPAVKAVGENKAERIFYLTAKTITRTVAENAFDSLRTLQGLRFKTVTLTAKDKICVLEKSDCNPVACPRANGHFDRINDCIYDMLTNTDAFDRDTVYEYADKYQVCPFELSLDMSLWADAVICDYNYVFDPFVYLKRFFSDGIKGENVFLIDEAHNLLDRGREMYSSNLFLDELVALRSLISASHPQMAGLIKNCEKEMEKIMTGTDGCEVIFNISLLMQKLETLIKVISSWLEDHAEGDFRDEILDFYFDLSKFSTIYDLCDDKYVIYAEQTMEEGFRIRLLCVDPSDNLAACMMRARSTILFSATLLPIQYYKKLLGGGPQDYEVYAESIFDPAKCGRLIATDVTSRYTRRGESEYKKIANYIHEIVSAKPGNYLIFFPSRLFMEDVGMIYEKLYYDENTQEILVQNEYMTEEEREDFLMRFTPGNDIDFSGIINMEVEIEASRSILGFCVMGGIFSEGIDLRDDSLIGVIIVGTGIPQVCNEREIIKEYFEQIGEDGFDYAYRYPGMNKVLQAAGRVIRTENDVGVVALLDERFTQRAYTDMFPREWKDIRLTSTSSVKNDIKALWERI
ncbi:MAG: ATP-dependent DNA helicase [Butyrivibrio sp.]|uniref:ATP-dependent DNA helicase n=1 Tax=Butyrivibrio sp. TaxID=28121 RepID=UPI0025DE6068|nr:ATP-dependent DNA helicase [Butyrivibrio sp.]MCR5772215.1 ATP-dependent DNA helicase [Butyrivibrio sp.]